jgi:hypothetical protein
MKLYEVLLIEKLALKTAKKYVKGWDKTRYHDIFSKYTDDPKAYRIYLPLEASSKKITSPTMKKIELALEPKGYIISDYVGGYAIEKDKEKPRIMKIGKLLDNEILRNEFSNDKIRATGKKSSMLVVISRHPYDIAGMSTDRGWTSCMNLKSGSNRRYVAWDVKLGSVIAYLINPEDKNIEKPIGRIMIKPFFNPEDKKQVAFGMEDTVYGTSTPGFKETVLKWVNEVNDSKDLVGIFELGNKLYNDSSDEEIIVGDKKDPEYIGVLRNWRHIKTIKDPSEKLQKAALHQNVDALKWIKNPSEEILAYAISQSSRAIQLIKNPSEKLIWAAIKNSAYAWKYIKNQTEENKIKAIKVNPQVISHIAKPSVDLMVLAVSKDAGVIEDILDNMPGNSMAAAKKLPREVWAAALRKDQKKVFQLTQYIWSDKNKLEMLRKYPDLIDEIDDATDEMIDVAIETKPSVAAALWDIPNKIQMKMVKRDPSFIKYIDNSCRAAEFYVVNQDVKNYKYIRSPDWDTRDLVRKLKLKQKKAEAEKAKE